MRTTLLVISILVTTALSGSAQNRKIALDSNRSSTVIVQFTSDADDQVHARFRGMGASLKQYLPNLRMGVYEVSKAGSVNHFQTCG